jgi:uncharacterized caspase-like protein
MRRLIVIACAMSMALLLGITTGHAEKRVALVIGNSAYQAVPNLPNPVNDASDVANLFKAIGFDIVETRRDVAMSDLRRAVSDFSDVAYDADIAVVYYAGHGLEVDGENYVVPVDARLTRGFDIDDEALSLDRILRAIEPARRLRLVILDACRDNPFVNTMRRSVASRSIGRGLARVEPTVSDTLIAFAAKAGSVALDGESRNSPFATALIKHLATPGLDIRLAFGRVRDDVMAATARRQEPFMYGSLGGTTISLVRTPTELTPSANPSAGISEAAQAWAATKDTSSATVLEAFISQYGGSYYVNIARERLEELKAKQPKTEIVAKNEELKPDTSQNEGRTLEDPAKVWAATQNTTSIAVLEDFIRQFGNTVYGSMAGARLAELRNGQIAALTGAPSQTGSQSPAETDAASIGFDSLRQALPRDVPINSETLRLVQTAPFFANAPPVRVASYEEHGKSNKNDVTMTMAYKVRPLGRGLAQYEESQRFGGNDYEHVGVLAGNGLINLSQRVNSNYGGHTLTEIYQTRIDNVAGALFPVAVGNQFGYRTVTTISPNRTGLGDLVYEASCRGAEKRAASEFNRDLSGDAFIFKCEAASYYEKQMRNPKETYWVFFVELGFFLAVDTIDPTVIIRDQGYHETLTNVALGR